ncbi:MAG TPA: hypothetical protein VLI54_05810 [Bacillota bacterium]|nr:hypothetical protein [Bacillota bacterium]
MKCTEYNYTVTSEAGLDPASNVAIWTIAPGSETEPIHVTNDRTVMDVGARRGVGELVIYDTAGERHIHTLGQGLGRVSIGAGEIYQYLNTAAEPLEIVDICSPPFSEGDELSLEPCTLQTTPSVGDYYVLWSAREPRQAHLAGTLRLLFLEHHDTSAGNAARSGVAKAHTQPIHWHAAAQRAGEQDIWPVNVRLTDNMVHIELHAQSYDALPGTPPSFRLQSSPAIYRCIDSIAESEG